MTTAHANRLPTRVRDVQLRCQLNLKFELKRQPTCGT